MSVAQAPSDTTASKKAALDTLYDDIHTGSMFPFWATSTSVDHDEIKQLMATAKAVPFVWKYGDMLPMLERAAARDDG